MPRPPNSKVGKSLTIHARTPIEEQKIKAFKELHARNPDLEIHQTIMEYIDNFLIKHNYPPGNSQTILETFIGDVHRKCFRCGNMFKTLRKVKFISGKVASVCSVCYDDYMNRTLIKKDLGII